MDLVAAGILGVAGAACIGRAQRVYQFASGDVNPLYVRRSVELSALSKSFVEPVAVKVTPK